MTEEEIHDDESLRGGAPYQYRAQVLLGAVALHIADAKYERGLFAQLMKFKCLSSSSTQ